MFSTFCRRSAVSVPSRTHAIQRFGDLRWIGQSSRWFADQGWSLLVSAPQSKSALIDHDFHNTRHLQDLMEHLKIPDFRLCVLFMQKELFTVNLLFVHLTQESQVSKSVTCHCPPSLDVSCQSLQLRRWYATWRMQRVRMVSLSSDTRVLSGDQLLCWNRIPCEDSRPFGDSSRSEVHAQWTVRAQDTQPLVSRSDPTLPSTCPVHPLAFRTTSSLLCRQPCQPPFPRPRDEADGITTDAVGTVGNGLGASLEDDALASTRTTHDREFSLRIFQRSSLVSSQQGFSQSSTGHLVTSHRLFDAGATCRCMRFRNSVQNELRHTAREWNRIASIRHSFSGRSVSALRGLHQQSPVSDVHLRSVLQRSQVVPLRNLGFQEPVATARQQACPGALGSLSLPEVFPADFEFVRHLAQCLCRTPTFSQRLRGTIGTIQRSNAPTFGETTGSLANGEIEDMISENREHFAKCSPFQSLMWSCSMWFASCEWDKPG